MRRFKATRCICISTVFETVDEAVSIINELNSSPKLLNDYIEEVYNEVINEYDWSTVTPKYWIPLIEKFLNKS